MVGPDIVLTASHVVPWDADGPIVQFVPAYYNGVSTVGPSVYSYVIDASSYDASSQPAPDADFAVLRLQDRLGDSLGYFGVESYWPGWNFAPWWTLVGYPVDIAGGEQPSWQNGIYFHDADVDDAGDAMELETQNGDATPGDSGGPLFSFWSDGFPYIVSVMIAEEIEADAFPLIPESNNVGSAGSALMQLVAWARANWN